MKLEVFNEQSKPNQTNIEKINKDNLIKYSSFFNNSLKIGLNNTLITYDDKISKLIYDYIEYNASKLDQKNYYI